MQFRTYTEADYEALWRFLVALNRGDRTHVHWNWARLEWMYEHPEFDRSLMGAIGLWCEGEAIVGAAIYDMYFGEAFCAALPAHRDLFPEILDYAWRELRDENGLGIALCDENQDEIEAALAAGFFPTEGRETIMELKLDRPLPVRAEGFGITELDQTEDAEALQWLVWQGFDHGDDRAEFEQQNTPPERGRVHFNKELSLGALSPEGEPVACCCLWYRPDTDYAYVEPVCTIPAWRGRGAAKALIYEAANRARALGAKTAYVISDQVFYEKLGFRKVKVCTFYWKKETPREEPPC